MFVNLGLPHFIPLVALSLLLAALGGYVGLGLAGQARESEGMRQQALLAGAAWALGLGVWTMHFVGILAARFPAAITFSIFVTLLSFLICVLVVGISAFLVSRPDVSGVTTVLAAIFMGGGIVSMHYVGMHAISGPFSMRHSFFSEVAAATLAIAASYAALRLLEFRLKRLSLTVSAAAFGLAVSGMHYTAMSGMSLDAPLNGHHDMGPSISSDVLTIAVAVLAFFVSAFFLLYLVPEVQGNRDQATADPVSHGKFGKNPGVLTAHDRLRNMLVPVETEGTTRLLPWETICTVQATTHYTLIYDGQREYFSPWSISEAEEKLAGLDFMRVHRSHLIALNKVSALRRVGESAAVEIGQPTPRVVPVSRSHYAELKARLGLRQKMRGHIAAQ